jgi:hypothetical protein
MAAGRGRKNGSSNNFWTAWNNDAISAVVANPNIFDQARLLYDIDTVDLSTFPDFGQIQKKMVTIGTGSGTTEHNELAYTIPTANRLPVHFATMLMDTSLTLPSPDTAQRWLINGIQDGDYSIGIGNSFSTVWDGAAIPTSTPYFRPYPSWIGYDSVDIFRRRPTTD